MSSGVPPATRVLVGTPKAGSVAEIDAAGSFVDDIVDDCAQFNVAVLGAVRSLFGAKSVGVTRIKEKMLDRLLPGSDMLAQSAEEAKKAFNTYASEVNRIHNSADRIKSNTVSDLESLAEAMREIERIAHAIGTTALYTWQQVPPGHLPDPVLSSAAPNLTPESKVLAKQNLRILYENQWLAAAIKWKTALENVNTSKTEWTQLITERRDAEKRLTAGLEETAIGHLIALGSGTGNSAKHTIALAVSGELWGKTNAGTPYGTTHPYLKDLIGSQDGAGILDAGLDPEIIAARWHGLGEEKQNALIAAVPWVIGNLPGLSGEVRDKANRMQMDFFREHPQLLTPEQLKLAAEIQRILTRESAENAQGGALPPVQILALNMKDDVPKAAVAYGNVDTDGNITWMIPGMLNDASEGLRGMDAASRNLYNEQSMLSAPGKSNSVIAWLGYDTPGSPTSFDFGVLSSDSAIAGAKQLAAEINGLDASRLSAGSELPVRSVAAHSYGTTTASIALKNIKHPVDAFVMLGSAGLDTGQVESFDVLKVKEAYSGQKAIYTTHAAGDHLAPGGAGLSGRGQPNPSANAFGIQNFSPVYGGALSFSAEGDAARQLQGTDGHSLIGEGSKPGAVGMSASQGRGYLDPLTESLNSIARITSGNIDEELSQSFARTEAERVEMVIDPYTGHAYPYRVKDGE